MAAPAILTAIKAAAVVASDERSRKAVGVLIAAVLTPLILIVVILLSLMSGIVDHNNAAVDLSFHGGLISSQVPEEYQQYIEEMRDSFVALDVAIDDVNAMTEDGELERYRVKAIFYSLFFGRESVRMDAGDYRVFVDCFVEYEERTETETDENGVETEETYEVAIPIADLTVIYHNIESGLGTTISGEQQANAQRIYGYAKYGQVLLDGSGLAAGAAMGDGSYQALLSEATKYIAYPYVWGGSSPSTSFDCSGYICWVYTQSGVYYLPRTNAQGIFNQCAVISRSEAKPGDLVFFTKTYAASTTVTHVGIFVGGNEMLHCGSPIGYANIDSSYWRSKFFSFGRLPSD